MSGMIGIIANDTGRYSLFAISLTTLRTPPNTIPQWALTSDRIIGRNSCVEKCLETGSEWIVFIDDDHVFPHDLVTRLLAHEKPIVGSLYLQRMVPFAPIAYSHKTDDERYIPIQLNELPGEGLIEVAAVGTGGMLIRSEILRAIEPPWFEHGRASEDLIFCDKVLERGLGPIYLDLSARMGHMTPAAIWPSFDESWSVGFSVADSFSLKVPIETEVEEYVGASPG